MSPPDKFLNTPLVHNNLGERVDSFGAPSRSAASSLYTSVPFALDQLKSQSGTSNELEFSVGGMEV